MTDGAKAPQAAETNPVKAPKGAASDIVVVGCKLPNGLVLNLDRYVPIGPPEKGQIRREVSRVGPFTLRGWAHERDKAPPADMVGGYALTPIPRDFWEEWLKRNEDSDLLRDGLIFAGESLARAKAEAQEKAAIPLMYAPARPGDVPGVGIATDGDEMGKGKPLIAHNTLAVA